MRKFGLIGKPLTHSFSKSYFEKKFDNEGLSDCSYQAYEISEISDIEELFENGITGLNVTSPFKEDVIQYLDYLEDLAYGINAVNTIKKVGDKFVGFNTDVYGFKKSLNQYLDFLTLKNALILGTGGSSKAVSFVLDELGINYNYISRSDDHLNYSSLKKEDMQLYDLIVNTTPLGMHPNIDACPMIPYEGINEKHLAFDLIYNPEKTLFLTKAEQQSAKTQNGYEMLVFQAEKSWEIWNKPIGF